MMMPGAPRFRDGAAPTKGTRCTSASLLPDDSVLVTGGSDDYRGPGPVSGPEVHPASSATAPAAAARPALIRMFRRPS